MLQWLTAMQENDHLNGFPPEEPLLSECTDAWEALHAAIVPRVADQAVQLDVQQSIRTSTAHALYLVLTVRDKTHTLTLEGGLFLHVQHEERMHDVPINARDIATALNRLQERTRAVLAAHILWELLRAEREELCGDTADQSSDRSIMILHPDEEDSEGEDDADERDDEVYDDCVPSHDHDAWGLFSDSPWEEYNDHEDVDRVTDEALDPWILSTILAYLPATQQYYHDIVHGQMRTEEHRRNSEF